MLSVFNSSNLTIYQIIDKLNESNKNKNYVIFTQINNKIVNELFDNKICLQFDFSILTKCMMTDKNISNCKIPSFIANSNAYDENLNIIINSYAIETLYVNLFDILNTNHKINCNQIGILSGQLSDMKLLTLGFIICTINNIPTYLKLNLGSNELHNLIDSQDEIISNSLNIVINGDTKYLSNLIASITTTPTLCIKSSDSDMSKTSGLVMFNTNDICSASIYASNLIKYKKTKQTFQSMANLNYFSWNIIDDCNDSKQLLKIFNSPQSYFNKNIKYHDLIFINDKSGTFSNFTSAIINYNCHDTNCNLSVPIVELISNDTHETSSYKCSQHTISFNNTYATSFNNKQNLNKLINRFDTFFNNNQYSDYNSNFHIFMLSFICLMIFINIYIILYF